MPDAVVVLLVILAVVIFILICIIIANIKIVKQTRAGRAGCENTVEARMRFSVRINLHSHYKSQLPNTCVQKISDPKGNRLL